jgi:hypothetical protein
MSSCSHGVNMPCVVQIGLSILKLQVNTQKYTHNLKISVISIFLLIIFKLMEYGGWKGMDFMKGTT